MSPDVVFGPFRLHAVGGRLLRGAHAVPLAPKAFALLQYLARRPGHLVTKEELLRALWPDTHVTEEVLKVCVREVRKALGDDARSPSFIETAHRRGYRFIGQPGSSVLAPARIVGREAELAGLRALLEQALGGGRRVVLVSGEPGIGKTATVEAFLERAAAEPGVLIARGQCVEQFGAGEAYLPVLDALGRLARGPAGDWLAGHLRRYAPTWLVQMPSLMADEEREQLQREVLGSTPGRMLREIAEAIEALTAGTPLVLLLEDLHWSDYSTLDLISLLAGRREPARLLLIGTYRGVEVRLNNHPLRAVKQELSARGLCEALPLGYLAQDAVEEYLRGRFPGLAHLEELARAIHGRTDGNPLFMVNLVDYVASRGLLGRPGAAPDLTAARREIESGVPDSLRQMIEKQIDRLTLQERSVLEAASATSLEFSALAVAAGLEAELQEVEEVCDRLARRAQFLRTAGLRRLPDGTLSARYAFIHSLYQNVVYGQTPLSRRLRIHQRIAERGVSVFGGRVAEIAVELAMHFEQGRDYEGAVRHLQIAAANASRRRAYREAIDHLARARDLVRRLAPAERADQQLGILEQLGAARRSMGDMRGAAADFGSLAASARRHGRPDAEARGLLYQASSISWIDGRRCLGAALKALEVSRNIEDPLLQAHTRAYSGYWHLMLRGWSDEGARACEEAIAAARGAGDVSMLSQHLVRQAYFQCLRSSYGEARATALEGQRLTVEIDEAFDYLVAQFFLCWALLHSGRWGETLRAAGEGMRMAERNEHLSWAGLFQLVEAWLLEEASAPEGARLRCERSLSCATESGFTVGRAMALALLGKACLGLGQLGDALRRFDEAVALVRREPVVMGWVWQVHARLGMAEALLASGSTARAREQATRALELACVPGEATYVAQARALRARILLAEGAAADAEEEILRALEALDGHEAPLAEWRAFATAAEIAEARGAVAAPSWERSAAALLRLAESLEIAEELRRTFLSGARVRAILDKVSHAA